MPLVTFNQSEIGFGLASPTTWTLTCVLQSAGAATSTVSGTLTSTGECDLTLTTGNWTRTLSNGTDTVNLPPVAVLSTGQIFKGAAMPGIVGPAALEPPAEFQSTVITHASVASNGASASLGGTASNAAFWRAPQNLQVVDAWWEPIGASNTAASTASYRQVGLIDQGPAGAGTAALGSLNLTASLASFATRALSLVATPTMSKGDVLCASQSASGTDATHTVLQAGQFTLLYKPI